jgi:nucleoside-diphosphate-sugar epimerase
VIPGLIEAVRQQRSVIEHDERSGADFIYVEDAVAATLAAARAPRAAGNVINIGSGQMSTIGDVVRIVVDLLRASAVPGCSANRETEPLRIVAKTMLASELLDFTPRVSLIAGLARMVRTLAAAEEAELLDSGALEVR